MSIFVKTYDLLNDIRNDRYREVVRKVCNFFYGDVGDVSKLYFINYPSLVNCGFAIFGNDDFFYKAHQEFMEHLKELNSEEMKELLEILEIKFITNK